MTMHSVNGTTVNVLMVDDDEVDVESLRRSFVQRKISNPLHVAHDGVNALEMLRGEAGKPALDRPLIVLLDINMPRMSGLEFLQAIRADEWLRDLVVFVLTTSADQSDVYDAYNLNVAGYILKSNAGDCFLDAIDLIDCYWRIVELPK